MIKGCRILFLSFILLQGVYFANAPQGAPSIPEPSDQIHQEYIDFFEEVYKTMQENYYYPVTRENFDRFMQKFDTEIYPEIKEKQAKSNFINWRSAAYLVDYLKDPQDTFSAFFPPKYAKKYEKEVLGQRVDLGIEGKLADQGFLVVRVEPRSDAFVRGLRPDDIILTIDKAGVLTLSQKDIEERLTPLIDTEVSLKFFDHFTKRKKAITVVSQEYFKQSVFMVPVKIPGVYCLEIKTFNRKTSEDLFRFISEIERQDHSSLILDLRGNPGGPPLAAREISGFFLPPGNDFAYFEKKGERKAALDVPKIPEEYHYKGPVAILVDKESGSASELFSGVLQKYKRAVLVGAPTAGKVFLKSMFHFDDESMLLLVTARGFFPDGSIFEFDGVKPDIMMEQSTADPITFAANYLVSQKQAAN